MQQCLARKRTVTAVKMPGPSLSNIGPDKYVQICSYIESQERRKLLKRWFAGSQWEAPCIVQLQRLCSAGAGIQPPPTPQPRRDLCLSFLYL